MRCRLGKTGGNGAAEGGAGRDCICQSVSEMTL